MYKIIGGGMLRISCQSYPDRRRRMELNPNVLSTVGIIRIMLRAAPVPALRIWFHRKAM